MTDVHLTASNLERATAARHPGRVVAVRHPGRVVAQHVILGVW